MSAEARLEILTRINRVGAREAEPLVRAPVRPSSRPHGEVVEQFAEHAAEYRANVVRVGAGELREAVQNVLAARGSGHVVIPPDLPSEWLPADLSFTPDEPGVTDLTAFDAVVTGMAVAIAETGTVVLDHGPGQGRRALTLVPDHHVCIVREAQVVDSVPEAVARLEGSVRAGRPLTWISGPSATSDIELSRVEGVHGPRVLDLILVREDEPPVR
ncbi:hypothetical protein DAERI_070174 [Deinococcus aerius]|uniref:LUD domain-containing protein n=1 Tax=Deinococcus aerius TaxID=200253 RepID=A0A2I9D654_9DEIO|nr:lactate utilization protein C [Deinococcus aerius]GBF06176.1 hypothetical protein DAERI_070174 [Deinococcus aerius]